MKNFQQPKVEYSVAIEGIKRLDAQLLMLDSVMGELQEMHNKTEKILEDLISLTENDPAMKDVLEDDQAMKSWHGIVQGYQKELLEYRQRLTKIEEKRGAYKDAINKLIETEQWMQEQMAEEGHSHA